MNRTTAALLVIVAMGVFGCDDVDTTVAPASLSRVDRDTRIDRMGMPAVATAVITSKQAYNEADPTDDAAGTFVGEIVNNLTALHAALDDDLIGLGLTPCTVDEAVAQAAPLVVPDVIKVDTSAPSGFPNGRRLTDTVIDVTLAVIFLDVAGLGATDGPHTAGTLVGVNPTANDEAFSAAFPYLAQPHQP
jgi:hypothetical protein